MKCEYYRELISARLDGEIESGELDTLQDHLKQCPGCSAFARQVKQLQELAADSPPVSMPTEVEGAILSRTDRQQSLWRRLFRGHYSIPRPLAWAAALALLFLALDAARGPGSAGDPGNTKDRPAITRPLVQRIVLTEADVVQTYTTGSYPDNPYPEPSKEGE